MLICNVRPWGKPAVDISVTDGVIHSVSPSAGSVSKTDTSADAGSTVDGHDRIILPSFSDVHVHLDSSRIGLPFRPHTGRPGVWGMMMNDRENWRDTEIPHRDIVAQTMERMISNGTTRIRTYAQVDVDCKLERLESVLDAKEVRRACGYPDHCLPASWSCPRARIRRDPRGIAQGGRERGGRN